MAIRTKKADVPSEFPPARLFLDDIEEIVRIFRELVESRIIDSRSTVEDLKTEVRFSTAGEECDDVQDLPKIAKRFRELEIKVSIGVFPRAFLTLHPIFTTWFSFGPTEEAKWSAFHKLQPIFKKRNRLWGSFVRSLPWWALSLLLIAFTSLFPLLRYPLYMLMPHPWAAGIVVLLEVLILIAILVGFHGTYLTPRNSWEPSPIRQYLKDKLIPVVTAALLGIGGTLLGLYLRHKYWP